MAEVEPVEQDRPNSPNLLRPPLGPNPINLLESYKTREDNLLESMTPMDLIFGEDVPVDEDHVEELARSIESESEGEGRTGQLQPILLAEVPGYSKFMIVDGFHRTPALKSLGRDQIFATIRTDCSWEKLIDLRILAAHSHKSVKFSRLIDWVEDAWAMSPWSHKITATQAFTFGFIHTMNGSNLDVDPTEVNDIRHWVVKKSKQWDVPPSTVWNNLNTASISDPALVSAARERKGGHRLEQITPNHLKAIAQALPYRFEFQNLVASVAVENDLTIPKTKMIALSIAECKDMADAVWIVSKIDFKNLAPVYSNSHTRARRRAAAQMPELKFTPVQFTIHRIGELASATEALIVSKDKGEDVVVSPEDAMTLRAIAARCLELSGLVSAQVSGVELEDDEEPVQEIIEPVVAAEKPQVVEPPRRFIAEVRRRPKRPKGTRAPRTVEITEVGDPIEPLEVATREVVAPEPPKVEILPEPKPKGPLPPRPINPQFTRPSSAKGEQERREHDRKTEKGSANSVEDRIALYVKRGEGGIPAIRTPRDVTVVRRTLQAIADEHAGGLGRDKPMLYRFQEANAALISAQR